MPRQAPEGDPLDALPMRNPIKPRPRQADNEQYTHQPEDKHCSPGSANHISVHPGWYSASDVNPLQDPCILTIPFEHELFTYARLLSGCHAHYLPGCVVYLTSHAKAICRADARFPEQMTRTRMRHQDTVLLLIDR